MVVFSPSHTPSLDPSSPYFGLHFNRRSFQEQHIILPQMGACQLSNPNSNEYIYQSAFISSSFYPPRHTHTRRDSCDKASVTATPTDPAYFHGESERRHPSKGASTTWTWAQGTVLWTFEFQSTNGYWGWHGCSDVGGCTLLSVDSPRNIRWTVVRSRTMNTL
ncbi:hypothetical protein BJV78DRAFT_1168140 [Lactifluus subvellereus]|nr:hypothetical protein BJV78DRAFT_1168140 [Lactifluus subvellereus]